MGLRILHTADWHLGFPFASFPEESREFLRSAQRSLPQQFARACREQQCDLAVLAGDIFDAPSPARDWVDCLKAGLRDCGIPVVISPGNHDYCCPDSPWWGSFPENVHIFTGGLESISLPGLDCRVYGAGYQSMDCPPLLRGFRAEGNERYCIGVLHADPTRADSPYSPVLPAQVLDSGLDYLALGHIHHSGSFQAGTTLCAWPGCPMGRGWDMDDPEHPGFLLVTLEELADLTEIAVDVPRFYSRTLTGSYEASARAILPPVPSSDFYRLILKGETEEGIAELRNAFPHLPHLTVLDETHPAPDLWEYAGEDSLRGVYFSLLHALESNGSIDSRLIHLAARLSREVLEGRQVELP